MIDELDIVVVNTGNVNPALNSKILYIQRPNLGRDLYSYAVGLKNINRNSLKHIVLINDSVIWEKGSANQFWKLASKSSYDVVGMTESKQGPYHLQSYAICINNVSTEALTPIESLRPSLMKRTLVEFGEKKISRDWIRNGLSIGPLWKIESLDFGTIQFSKYYGDDQEKISLLLSKSVPLNPTIHLWAELFLKAGVIKKSLLNKNPAKLISPPKSIQECRVIAQEINNFFT